MERREWTTRDKLAEWGEGPWVGEPDKVQWSDSDTGLPCLAVRSPIMGMWCGYVGVAEGHPAFGQSYRDVDSEVDVHGGLSFASSCQEDAPEGYGICHIPGPNEPEHVWWLGFDCGHYMDYMPRVPDLAITGGTYRTLAYVQAECANLARQLADSLVPIH